MLPRISILGLVLLLAATANTQEFKCPASHGKKPLFNAAVFDGPPEKMGELEPYDSRGNTSYTYALWLFKTGFTPFLACEYGNSKDYETVTIKVDKPVQRCVFRVHGAGLPATMICK